MYRSTNKLAEPLRVAVFGAPGTGKEQFSTLLSEALGTAGIAAEIATPAAIIVPCKAEMVLLMGIQSTRLEDVDADMALRQLLARHELPYQVFYGTHRECLVQAINLIRNRFQDTQDPGAPKARPHDNRAKPTAQWVWACDKCSDPQCEHRLLTGLLASRAAALTGQLP